MGWQDSPQAGEAYTRGRETRTVSDRSLGGDVLYFTGRARRRHHRVTEREWFEWANKARCAECEGEVGLVYTHYQFCSSAPDNPASQNADDPGSGRCSEGTKRE